MKRIFTRPPLPFIGAKKNCFKELAQVINEFKNSHKDHEEYIFVDLFGWSGLLSQKIKEFLPNNHVVWNDYENYSERLEKIAETEKIRQELYEIVKNKKSKDACSREEREKILAILEKYPNYDKKTIISWLNFSGSNKKIEQNIYNGIPKNPLQDITYYLDGIERVSMDYKELFEQYRNKKVFFLFDPPYLNTKNDKYKMRDQMGLADFLEIAEKVTECKKWILFTSPKSSTEEFLNYLKKFLNDLDFKKIYYSNNFWREKEYMLYNV